MKRILFLAMTVLLALILAGCDWFGTTITIPSDLTSTTTTTTTTDTGTTTSTTTVTASPTQYTVTFYDSDMTTVLGTDIVDPGEDATPPANPSKAATAQYTYTFAGWSPSYEDVSANLSVYASYVQTLRQYTVTFFDDDGSIIVTRTVDYGGAAIPPPDPTKSGYLFTGWNGEFTNVLGNLAVIATYNYDLEALVILTFGDYVPSQEEIDERILIIKRILGTETDEETGILLSAAMNLKDTFGVGTLSEMVTWYNGAKTLGFDREQLVDMAMNAMLWKLETELDGYDPAYLNDEIDIVEAAIVQGNTDLNEILADMHDYCDLSTDVSQQSQCHQYVNYLVGHFTQGEEFNKMLNEYEYDIYRNEWDYYEWSQLEYTLDDLLFYTYEVFDPDMVTYYTEQLNSLWSMLSSEELAMYEPVFLAYQTWMTNFYTTVYASEEMMYDWTDLAGNYIIDTVKNSYFWPYQTAYWDLNYQYYYLNNLLDEQTNYHEQHEIMIIAFNYLDNPTNLAKVRGAVETVYDVIDSVILGVDEPTFDLIVGLITGSIDPKSLDMSAEALDGYTEMAADMMRLIASTVDQADYDNITSLLKDVAGLYVASTDKTELEKAALLSAMHSAIDQHATALGDIYGEIIDLLDSMTPEKIQIILDQINLLSQGQVSTDPYDMVVSVATLVDTIAGEGEFDILAVAGYLADGYFDVRFQLSYDAEQEAITRALILDEMATLLLLADEIKDYDTEFLTAEQIQKLNDFMSGIQWLMKGFQIGLEFLPTIEAPGYVHEQFVELVYRMYGWDTDTETVEWIITEICAAYGTTEELTYYQMLVLSQFIPQLQYVTTFEEFQTWYGKVALLGYDHELIVDVATTFLSLQIQTKALSPYWVEEMDYTLARIDELTTEIATLQTDKIDIDAAARAEITAVCPDPTSEGLYVALWEGLLAENPIQLAAQFAYDEVRYSNEYNWMWDGYFTWQFENLLVYLENVYRFNSILQYDEVQRNQNQVYYDNTWAAFSPEQQTVILLILDDYQALFTYRYGALMTLFKDVYDLGYTVYASDGVTELVLYLEYSKSDSYYDDLWIAQNENEIMWKTEYLADLEQRYEERLAWAAFFADPANVLMVHDVISIVLDEFENLMTNADPVTMNLIIGLMNGSIDPSTLSSDALAIEGYAHEAGALLALLLSTVDEAEADKIILLAQSLLAVQINLRTDLTELEKADLIVLANAAIEEYYGHIQTAKGLIVTFLNNLTAAEIQTVIDNINIIDALGEATDDLSNRIRAVAIANIVLAVAGDGNLDTDTIIALGLGGYFDFRYDFEFEDPAYVDAKILEIQTLIDDIVVQANVIDQYDPTNLLAGEAEQINAFHLLIEELMVFLDTGPDPIV